VDEDDNWDNAGWRQPRRPQPDDRGRTDPVGRRGDEPAWPESGRGDERPRAVPNRGPRDDDPTRAARGRPDDATRAVRGGADDATRAVRGGADATRAVRGGADNRRSYDDGPTRAVSSRAGGPDPLAPPRRRRRWGLVTGYSVLGLVSLLVLSITGYAWATYTTFNNDLHRSDAKQVSGVKSSLNGDTNILIMGLDTRLDENGNPLPQDIYDALHAGDQSNGGENANVLMLLHVPANGQATEISIPRDDYASLPGCPDGTCKEKIKQGYGLAFDQQRRLLVKQGVSGTALEQQSRDAGREEEMRTVSQFLGGIPIDHFIEVTLVAFFEIANVVQPVTVCLQKATQDTYSGANFPAGMVQLNSSQSLAFVRQRRDNVKGDFYYNNFTDLDRERRQQAFIASLAYKLKQAGTFTNPAKLTGILNVAEQNIAVDSGFDLIKFAGEAESLTSGNITFHTLPIASYANMGGSIGDVNVVSLPAVQADVQSLIGGGSGTTTPSSTGAAPTTTTSSGPPPSGTVDVENASGVTHEADKVATALATKGFTKGSAITVASRATSVVEYGTDSSAGTAVADALGLTPVHSSAVAAGHVRVILGKDFSMPSSLSSGSSGGTPSTSSGPLPSQPAPNNNGNNDADTNPMSSISGGGVPCVK
jgi:LCP family protein required for cell wall assembly